MTLQFWLIQTLNSISMGGLLFLLAAGFSLIFGLLRVPNLAHGGFFMLGAYIGSSLLAGMMNFWLAAILSGIAVGVLGGLLERILLRRMAGNEQGQVLMTLGVAFIISDLCLMVWGGDPQSLPLPDALNGAIFVMGFFFPAYRLVVVILALIVAALLYALMERTRLGAMIRAGVDDREMARGVGIPISKLFTAVFFLGAAIAGLGGVLAGPIFSAYPGLDTEMLPLALIVVILGGVGSLKGALLGSFVIGFIYNFGITLFPSFAYVILFLPMIVALAFKPEGLLGRVRQ